MSPRFFMHTPPPKQSGVLGESVAREAVPYFENRIGDSKDIIQRAATPGDQTQYPAEWAEFQARGTSSPAPERPPPMPAKKEPEPKPLGDDEPTPKPAAKSSRWK